MLENSLVVMRSVILLILISLNISREFPLDDYIYPDDLDSSLHDDIIFEDYKEDLYQDSEKKVQIRSVIKDPVYRWKDGIIYYYIDEVFTTIQRAHIIQQMEEIANVTCLQFKPKTKTSSDYVHIMGRSNGCHSQVGRRGGRQVLNLKPSALNTGCFRKGVVKHEMMHTIGFYHEHNAPDRDDYITINWENIQDDKISNFDKQLPEMVTNFSIPYDYDSMSHYGRRIFSKNGLHTITPRDPNAIIGQRDRLSDADIYKIKLMYNC